MAESKAEKQPKNKPKAEPAVAPPPPGGVAEVRTTTSLRCPICNRLSEWNDTFLEIHHGARVQCPNCGETMALP